MLAMYSIHDRLHDLYSDTRYAIHSFFHELKFNAFCDGHGKAYGMYLRMREKYPGKNMRAPLEAPHAKGAPVMKFLHEHWKAGFDTGWSDAEADWVVSYSVQGMRAMSDELSFKEEREALRKKWNIISIMEGLKQ